MTPQEIQFVKDNIINFESVKLGFTRNIPFGVLEKYEELYRKYLDPQFSLTYWCGECVFDMLKRLIKYYESQVVTVQNTPESKVKVLQETNEEKIVIDSTSNGSTELPIEQPKKKRGRPKK